MFIQINIVVEDIMWIRIRKIKVEKQIFIYISIIVTIIVIINIMLGELKEGWRSFICIV